MLGLLLDTNVVVRFLTGDHPTHSPRSRKLFARAAAGEIRLVLSDVALAETAWVLAVVLFARSGRHRFCPQRCH